MSVLKAKRTVSKAEFVNTANQIYVETLNFLTRMSARYSRLLAEPVAKLAGEVVDHCEKANSIFPSDEQRKDLRKGASVRGKSISESAGCETYPLLSCNDAKPGRVLHDEQWETGWLERSCRKA